MPDRKATDNEELSGAAGEVERENLQQRISEWLDLPLAILSLIWVGLLVVELAFPLPPEMSERVLQVDYAIWFVFAAVFIIEFGLAPDKVKYLRSNPLAALSVALPFARVVRLVGLARVFRSLSLVRITLIANRASAAAAEIFSQHRLNYVLALTVIVTLLGGAGVFYFERDVNGTRFSNFGEALWWAATLVTTINIGAEPATLEGRIIALLLRVFAVAIFGYVAGSIVSFLVGQRSAERTQQESQTEAIARLTEEVERMRATLDQLQESRRGQDVRREG